MHQLVLGKFMGGEIPGGERRGQIRVLVMIDAERAGSKLKDSRVGGEADLPVFDRRVSRIRGTDSSHEA